MCLSKHLRKDFEKINERGKCLFKNCILKGANIDSKLCSEGWKNWSTGWSNEAKISSFNLFEFLWVSSGARPRYPREFLDSTWPSLSLPDSRAMILSVFVGSHIIVCVKNYVKKIVCVKKIETKIALLNMKIASLDISYCHPIQPIKFDNENCITR